MMTLVKVRRFSTLGEFSTNVGRLLKKSLADMCRRASTLVLMMEMVSVNLAHKWAITHCDGCSTPPSPLALSHTNKGSHAPLKMRAAAQATPPGSQWLVVQAVSPRRVAT